MGDANWGLFGGSFDPPHLGHVLAAGWVLSATPLERLIVVPTFEHAHSKKLTSFAHRLEMCVRAFSILSQVEICDIESRLPKPSYTITTLEALKQQHPGVGFHLVVGSDLANEVESWHRAQELLTMAPLLVVGRGGHALTKMVNQTTDLVIPEVSSSRVRSELARTQSADGLIPVTVANYIREHDLYGDEKP